MLSCAQLESRPVVANEKKRREREKEKEKKRS